MSVEKHAKPTPPTPPPPPNADSVPESIKTQNRWLLWKYEWSESRNKWTKPPVSPLTGYGIGATEEYAEHFVTFDEALSALARFKKTACGVGYYIKPPYVGIDFDDCRKDGVNHPKVEMWLPWFPGSYQEISPSETGVHVLGLGPNKEMKAVIAKPLKDGNGATFEVYNHSRYFTWTSRSIVSTLAVSNIESGIDKLLKDHGESWAASPAPSAKPQLMSRPTINKFQTNNFRAVADAKEGERNGNALLHYAAYFAGRAAQALGLTFEQVEAELLHIVCEKWEHPHPRRGAEATIRSGWNAGIKRPLTVGFGEKVFGDDRSEFLEEQARNYFQELPPSDLEFANEYVLFLNLSKANASRCAPAFPDSVLRRLSVRMFEQLTGSKVQIYPGMFEDDNQNETDTGYGKHFIRAHGYFVRYNKETSEWLVYSKGVWRVAHDEVEVGRYFKEQFIEREMEARLNIASLKKYMEEIDRKRLDEDYVPTMLEQSTIDLFDKAVADLKAALHGQESRNINSALEQARTEVGVDCVNADLDTDPLVFNCINASIDLRNSEPIGKRIHRLCTKQSKVIASDDGCPRFEQILSRSLPDEPTREYLQDFFGLCLSGLMVPDILIFLGDGANGKSLIRNIISGVLGDYHAKASMSTFLVSKNVNPGGTRSDLAGFRGKRLITASEANRKVMLDMELLKDWTGNEDINARDLWQKGKNAQFSPEGKILLLMNHAPRVIDQSEGTWRRLKYVRFDVIIPAEERNDKLGQEVLETEGSGVLNWMLTGWERVHERLDAGSPALVTPKQISKDTSEYKEKESVISRFFEEHLEAREGYKTRSADIYNCYASWCKRNNEYQESSTELSLSLVRHCSDNNIKIESHIKVYGARGFAGLKLKETFDASNPPE